MGKTLPLPEDALVKMLKALPEKALVDIFWKVLVESDTSALTPEDKEAIEEAKLELAKGETVKWEDIR
jgi:hypothetical protein